MTAVTFCPGVTTLVVMETVLSIRICINPLDVERYRTSGVEELPTVPLTVSVFAVLTEAFHASVELSATILAA